MRVDFRFPGLESSDDILGYLKVLASNNPSNYLKTRMAANGGFDFCASSKKDFWTKLTDCDPGFFPDPRSGFCYKLVTEKMALSDGEAFCQTNLDAELVYFDTDYEVMDFVDAILNAGTLKISSDRDSTESKICQNPKFIRQIFIF